MPEIFIDNKEFVEKLEKSVKTFEIQADPDRTNFPHLCNDELSRVKLEEVTSLFVIMFFCYHCVRFYANFDNLIIHWPGGRTVRSNFTNGQRAKIRKIYQILIRKSIFSLKKCFSIKKFLVSTGAKIFI